jgi:hypothetical protein
MALSLNTSVPIIQTGSIPTSQIGGANGASTSIASGKSYFDSGSEKYFQQKYNEIFHDIDLYLDNSGSFENPKRYYINPAAVLGLTISDTVNDWVADGSITFLYLPEGVSSEENNVTGQTKNTITAGLENAAKENGQVLSSYTFRGDGFDLLRVMIIPKTTSLSENAIKIGQESTKWMLSYVFSIYDIEDVSNVPQLQGIASSYMKCLKLKFHDVRYQMLQTANIEYSTSMPKDPSLTPNFQSEIAKSMGVLNTGDVLRDIFNEVLSKKENGGCEEFKILDDSNKWDKGKSEIFYTSPAQYSAENDIEYVYSQHVSSKLLEGPTDIQLNDMCLLHTDRATEFGKIEPLVLTPLTDFFEKAGKETNAPGELQKEHFYVTSLTKEEMNVATNTFRSPVNTTRDDIDLSMPKYGQILSYSFLDMSPVINSNLLCTTPVYSVDIGKREFNVEFKGNDVNSVRKTFAKSYISKLYKDKTIDDGDSLFLPILHKNKKELNMFPAFSLNGNNLTARQRNGFHNLLYTGLFQNACICFKVYGLTWRESGTFIGIDKSAGCADNDYNNKLYGQWFVVKVDHIFETGAYINMIYAVKIHRHKDLQTKFENTLDPTTI